MANPRVARQSKRARRSRGSTEAKLNITSMMDMFTIILVFLLKNFSTQGQIVTPATGLVLPTSTIERSARGALSLQISNSGVVVEDKVVLDAAAVAGVLEQKEFIIDPLQKVLMEYAGHAKTMAQAFNKEFSGEITIQGDVKLPYKLLTKVMYTCGQSGYPVMNLIVYRNE